MKRVIQKDKKGCGIAALAMVMNKRYSTVKTEMKSFGVRSCRTGIHMTRLIHYLMDNGKRPTICYTFPKGKGTYILAIRWHTGGGHYLVMKDGVIYDPGHYKKCAGPKRWWQYSCHGKFSKAIKINEGVKIEKHYRTVR